jgi:hypothetical protein
MKLGEIKLEALYLCFATPELCIDTENDEALGDTLFNLKNDSNYKDYLNASVGSINRCFAYLEAKGLVPVKTLTVRKTEVLVKENVHVLDLSERWDEILSVTGVFAEDDPACPVEYTCLNGEIRVAGYTLPRNYTVTYTPRIQRVFHSTGESYKIPLPEEISNIIPYYVKGDIFRTDDSEEAEKSMESFVQACAELSKNITQGPAFLRRVYSMEG